jgi:hypothetical protein
MEILIRHVRRARSVALAMFLLGAGATSAKAQDSAIGDALLAWCGPSANCRGDLQSVDALRLYGGLVTARVENRDTVDNKLGSADHVPYFELRSGNPDVRQPLRLCFPNPDCSRAASPDDTTSQKFNDWVKENRTDIFKILFPAGLSEGVSGKDAAQNYAQQFLLNTALASTSSSEKSRLRQSEAGGLFEFERYDSISRSGRALQGLYRLDGVHMSILGRYSEQNQNGGSIYESTPTRALSIATDFHPSVVVAPSLDLRVGVDARTGLLFSRAAQLDLGEFDFGGGAWMSGRKDFDRVRIGFGGLVQGSKSYLPSVTEALAFLADVVNDQPVAIDISYGVLGGYALSDRTSLNAKFLQTTPRDVTGQGRLNSTIVMGGLSYLVGGLTPVDVGYKVYKAGLLTAHSIFVQGYYGW